MTNSSEAKSVVDAFDIPLIGSVYDGFDKATMSFEVRDFGEPQRSLVVHFQIGDQVYTGIASWGDFTDGMDAMRARMLADNWDDALASLLGRSN